MNDTWKYILEEYANHLPPFNDYLINDYREDNIKEIPSFIETLLQECIILLGEDKVKYLGKQKLSPEDSINYYKTFKYLKNTIQTTYSSFYVMRYDLEFSGNVYPIHVEIPFMVNKAIIQSDTKYFPIFPIIERGFYRGVNELRFEVRRAWLSFRRTERVTFQPTEGKPYHDTIITGKVHQKKSKYEIPLPLYHLMKIGWFKTLETYSINKEDLFLCESIQESRFKYIKIKTNMYLAFNPLLTIDVFKRRVLFSIFTILNFYKKFTISQVYDERPSYFMTVYGRYTYGTHIKDVSNYIHAKKSIAMNDTLLDPSAIFNLKTLGMGVETLEEFLLNVFYTFDDNLKKYNPVDFRDKKLGSLSQIMGFICESIFNNLYDVLNSKEGLSPKTMLKFVRRSSKKGNWMSKSNVFRSNPSFYNDNTLLGIHLKKFRSLKNEEISIADGVAQKAKINIPIELLKSHTSQLAVESVLSISTSSPIKAGNINPYLEITKNGDFIIPKDLEII